MRLIDADEMIKRLQEWNTNDAMDKALYNFTMHRILEQPTIEPERKTGKWHYSDTMYNCDQCGSGFYEMSAFCPNCGADMRGENDGSD